MGNLSKLRRYAGKWSVKSVVPFDADEISDIKSAVIVDSEDFDNLSVKMELKSGGYNYLPLDRDSKACHVGENINVAKCFFVTLERAGDNDTYRIRIPQE